MDLDPANLLRLLRALTGLGLVEAVGDQLQLSARGRLLSLDAQGIKSRALLTGQEYLPVWADLAHSVKTGRPVYKKLFGSDAWQRRARQPQLDDSFNRVMGAVQARAVSRLLADFEFSKVNRVVDVGGGLGNLLAGVLQEHPHLSGVLFDLDHVVEQASRSLASHGVLDRCRIEGGSFLDAVPEGGEVYILQHILHDWDDADCAVILRHCNAAMGASSRLLVLESPLSDSGPESAEVTMLDLHMMVVLGGRERTRQQYEMLLRDAGLSPIDGAPLRAGSTIIQAVPSPAWREGAKGGCPTARHRRRSGP